MSIMYSTAIFNRILAHLLVLSTATIISEAFSPFVEKFCKNGKPMCSTSSPDWSINVRYQSQCFFECQHVGCAGVNYRQPGNICEIFTGCQTSLSYDIPGCQFFENELEACTTSNSNDTVNKLISCSNCSFPFTYQGGLNYWFLYGHCGGENMCRLTNFNLAYCDEPANYMVEVGPLNLTVSTIPPIGTLSVAGWIVIQNRIPTVGSQFNWQLNWTEYKNGFGDIGANFWIGLERIHLLTSAQPYRLRVEVQQISTGSWYSAEYWSVVIADESVSRYQLNVNGYAGDAGDSLQYTGGSNGANAGYYLHNTMEFSTIDVSDNATARSLCAQSNGGGWWFNRCYYACLTCFDNEAEWKTLSLGSYIMASRMMIIPQG